ncbi:hypothetical protein RUMCAL_02104 [Ruminococcus callidus ATCC 27760]|uniref:Uncharacterized protein n=1 Tax=Ruminococcus callidus ATCC 27760 TaxID=411473 RepID=U2K6P2_9FIRM|nr:hypothetical protein RUMCAL_02104 [Ruminococcus callidus ATCC 27760]
MLFHALITGENLQKAENKNRKIQRLPLRREKATFSYTKSTGSSCRLGRSGAFLLQSVDSVF